MWLVIGIGNEYRRDDGVGPLVARRLRALRLPGVDVLERGGEGTGLIAAWSGHGQVVVIDAVSSGAPAGTIHCFTAAPGQTTLPPSRVFRGTSHHIGLGEGIELAALLGQLPDRLVVYGVEGADFGEGTGLSKAVASAVDGVLASVLATLAGS